MSLLRRLGEKSWETPGPGEPVGAAPRPAAAAVGLFVYMGVALSLFLIMTAAYVMRMGLGHEHGHSTNDWTPIGEPPLLWINTAILLASSLLWERARRVSVEDRGAPLNLVIAGGASGLLFLAGQLALWQHYLAAGYYLADNPAAAFFYLLTAAHGLHLFGGLFVCVLLVRRIAAGADPARIGSTIGLCAAYWHFLFILWLLLAALLAMT